MLGSIASAATGAMGSVLEKLATMLGGACIRFMGVRGEVMFLRAELEHMNAFLIKLSRVEDPDEQAKRWMAEVRELSYDVEDSIDEFVLCVDGRSSSAEPPGGFRGFIDRSISLLTKIKTRRRLAAEIQRLKGRVKEAGERRARYKIDDNVCSQAATDVVAVDSRLCSLYSDESQLVGIDEPKKELIRLLKEGGGVLEKQLKVVSVVGFGGMGKTTLANQIYRTFGQQFKYHAFVSVSRNPDVMKPLRSILSQVSNQAYCSTEAGDERQLIDSILNFLQDKRYFIVVDDVWSTETWEIIKCAIPGNNFGSRIITTTRIKGVAESCSFPYANHVYELRPLSIVHSKALFLKRIFNSEKQCPPHLSRISDDILNKCGGLPLAILAISGLLANKAHTVDQWEQVQSSIGYALQRYPSVERMIRILSLSYFDLHRELRTCLLYLSIFPEDYCIEKSRLIRRWIAEGFIQEKVGHTIDELGERCFNELINRSLIQPWGINRYGEVTYFRVHDTILDFIVCKSVEENFVTLFGVPNIITPHNKVRRLSLQHKSNRDVILQPNLNYSHVRSLTVFGRSMEIPSLMISRFLRVLDLEGCHRLAGYHLNNIWNLFELKYLSLRNTHICQLSEQIAKLQNLETLNLEGTFINELPATIGRLQHLVHLLIERWVKVPDGTGNLQGLQELKKFSLSEQSTCFVEEIGRLTSMRDLSIFWDIPNRNSSSYLKKRKREQSLSKTSDVYLNNAVSSICKLGTYSLQSLSLDIYHGCEDVLQESWHPAPQSLRKLVITGAVIKTVPNWVGSLVNLQILEVNMEEVRQEDLITLGSLPGLLHLCLCIGTSDDKFYNVHLKISSSHRFTCLKHLLIGGKNCGLGLMLETGSLPKLENLTLEFDAIETGSLTNLDLAFGIQNLSCLTSIRCDISSLGEILPSSKTVMTAIERVVNTHPNHPRFEVKILG